MYIYIYICNFWTYPTDMDIGKFPSPKYIKKTFLSWWFIRQRFGGICISFVMIESNGCRSEF